MAEGADQGNRRDRSTLENKEGFVSYDLDQPLGKAIDGATSFRGEYDGRPVAVKRYVRKVPKPEGDAEPEEAYFQRYINRNTPHPNIARYYYVETLSAYWLIATELGQCSLYDYLKEPEKYQSVKTHPIMVLDEITQGLHALHLLRIAHRDIRPGSIILSFPDAQDHCRAMIEGFALTKLISSGDDKMSSEHHQRRLGWQAPEILTRIQRDIRVPEEAERRKQEMLAGDIFALGGLFYYALTGGSHPFGNQRSARDGNILSEDYQVPFPAEFAGKFQRYFGARSLITSMIQRDPNNRPKISEVMNHPMFWTEGQTLDFFDKASKHFENNRGTPKEVKLVNGLLGTICPENNWIACVETTKTNPTLVFQLNKRCGQTKKLKGQSVLDLLRAIRNSRHHHNDSDWPLELRDLLHATSSSFYWFWMNKFPELLLQVWQTLVVLKDDGDFKAYYDGTLRLNPPANAGH